MISAFTYLRIMDNTALIEALIGTTGIASIVGTALLARTPLLSKLSELAELKQKVEALIDTRLSQLESKVSYIQGKFETIENILSDGIVTPSEAGMLQNEYRDIKSEIAKIVRGGDAA